MRGIPGLLRPGTAIREYCDHVRIAGLIRLFELGRLGFGNHVYRPLSNRGCANA